MKHLKDFRKNFKLDQKANLQNVSVAVEAIYEAQKIGFEYLANLKPEDPKSRLRILSFLNLMSRIFEHCQAMLVALTTGSPASAEALGRIVVEGSINLMYLTTLGNASTLLEFFESWIKEHDKKLCDWKEKIQGKPFADHVGKMIDSRREVLDLYTEFLNATKMQCDIGSPEKLYKWPSNLFQRFEKLKRETDYYESYHRLSGSSHITSEDTLSWLVSANVDDAHARRMGEEAWAYSIMMTRIVSMLFVESIASCVITHGRTLNDDLQELRMNLIEAAHEIAKEAGVPMI